MSNEVNDRIEEKKGPKFITGCAYNQESYDSWHRGEYVQIQGGNGHDPDFMVLLPKKFISDIAKELKHE